MAEGSGSQEFGMSVFAAGKLAKLRLPEARFADLFGEYKPVLAVGIGKN